MDFVATADFHFGATIPGVDRFDAVKQVFRYAKENNADYLVVVGDIYDHLMVSNTYRARFNRMLSKATKYMKVVLLSGNHDVGVKTTSLSPIESLVGDRIRIITKPCRLRLGGKRVLFIPYTRAMDLDKRELVRVVKRFKGQYEFVFGHFSLEGVRVGPSNFTLASGVSKSLLRQNIVARHIILGHIHKPQSARNITYCGSPDYLDFGERNEKKRFLHSVDGGLKSIPTVLRPLCQVELSPEGVDGEIKAGGIFKIVVRCKKDEVAGMDVLALTDQIREAGGRVNKVSWEVQSKVRRRAKLIDFRKSLKFNIKEYINNFAPKKDRKEILETTKEVWNAAASSRDK